MAPLTFHVVVVLIFFYKAVREPSSAWRDRLMALDGCWRFWACWRSYHCATAAYGPVWRPERAAAGLVLFHARSTLARQVAAVAVFVPSTEPRRSWPTCTESAYIMASVVTTRTTGVAYTRKQLF